MTDGSVRLIANGIDRIHPGGIREHQWGGTLRGLMMSKSLRCKRAENASCEAVWQLNRVVRPSRLC